MERQKIQINSYEVNLTYLTFPSLEEIADWMEELTYADGIEPASLDIDITNK